MVIWGLLYLMVKTCFKEARGTSRKIVHGLFEFFTFKIWLKLFSWFTFINCLGIFLNFQQAAFGSFIDVFGFILSIIWFLAYIAFFLQQVRIIRMTTVEQQSEAVKSRWGDIFDAYKRKSKAY
jgi:hypothetical protein